MSCKFGGLGLVKRLSKFLNRQSALFLRGDFDLLLPHFAVPLAVHLEDKLVSLQSHAVLAQALHRHRDWLLSEGVDQLRPTVIAIDVPRRSRFRAWVDWAYLRADGTLAYEAHSIFYGRISRDFGPYFEMLQFTVFPQVDMKRMVPASGWAA